MQERGRPRIEVDYPVTLSGEGGNGTGRMTNLTIAGGEIAGGEIDSDLSAQIGAHIRVHIELSGARNPIDIAIAVIRWHRGHRFGVEFVRFEGNAKAQLEQMLNQSDVTPS